MIRADIPESNYGANVHVKIPMPRNAVSVTTEIVGGAGGGGGAATTPGGLAASGQVSKKGGGGAVSVLLFLIPLPLFPSP